MADTPDLAAAFDDALRQVERAIAGGMRTRDGEPARERLERLRGELEAQRAAAAAAGVPDPLWVRRTVRWVADWAPEAELALIAALGGIARAGGRMRAD